ncbi:MAG: reactive intermediate/imine deaminase [Acidimicrobiia bacterium]
MNKRTISVRLPKAGPYSPGVIAGDLVFVSGQVGFSPATGRLVEGGVEKELRQAFANAQEVLAEAQCKLSDVVKVTVFVTDLSQFPVVNKVFEEIFPSEAPARTTVEVSALPLGAAVEVDIVAAIPSG